MVEITNAEELFKQGLNLLRTDHSKEAANEAIKYLEQASYIDSRNKMIWFNLGTLYKKHNKERWRDAIRCFEQTVGIDPQFKPAWLALAQLYSKITGSTKSYRSIHDELMASYTFYSEIATRNNVYGAVSPVILAMVILLNDNGDYDCVITICNEHLDKTPTDYSFATQKAFALELQSLFNEAIRYYDLALEHGADTNRNLIHKALCYYAIGEYYQAIQFYKQALKLNDGCDIAHKGIGDCYSRLQMYDEALESYISAENIENKSDNIKGQFIEKGDVLFEDERFEEAIQTYLLALTGDSSDDLIYLNLGFCSILLNKRDEAVAYFEQAKKVNNNTQFAHEYMRYLM